MAARTFDAVDFGGASLTPLTLLVVVVLLEVADSRLGGFLTLRFFFPPSSPVQNRLYDDAWGHSFAPACDHVARVRGTCKGTCERQCNGGGQDDNRVEDARHKWLSCKAGRQLVLLQVRLDLGLGILNALGQCPAQLQDLRETRATSSNRKPCKPKPLHAASLRPA